MGDVIALSGAPTAEDEARRWIVRIDRGPLATEERAELHAWLASDARHAGLLDHYAKLWHAAGKARASAVDSHPARQAGAWHGRRAIAAGLCATAILALTALWPSGPQQPPAIATLRTAPGQHQSFGMSDGSRIELNTRSNATVDYQASRRQVALLDGEGYFEVAKDAKRPFLVLAGRTMVRAVGTRFTVYKRGDADIDVVVHEGVVEVSRFSDTQHEHAPVSKNRLVAGQEMRTRSGSFSIDTLTAAQLAQALAWQQGRVSFDNTPLAAAIEEMGRYAPAPIVIGDARIGQFKLSGSFSTQNVPTFLRTLEQVLPLKIEKGAEGAVIRCASAARCGPSTGSGR